MSSDGAITESNKSIAVRPFGFRDKIGYLCGDLGTCFILGLVNSFLMIYYTKEGANKQVISSQADSLIKISRIWADFFPANTSNQPI